MSTHQIGDIIVSGGAIDVLYILHHHGPQDDGDIPSKAGLAELITIGVAKKDYSQKLPNSLTDKGKVMAEMHYRDNPV
jgi:hypothetical protein